jgi:glyoxylase-like metal-dependent hydrolase (beta-lactamase superfamily II)
MQPVLETLTVSPFDENMYLVGDADAGVAVVVDPGGRTEDLVRVAGLRGVEITHILCTHAHIDHVAGAAALRDATGAPFWLHEADLPLLQGLSQQADMFGLPRVQSPEVDGLLTAGQVIEVGDLRLTVRETPGHAPGHVTFVCPQVQLEFGDHPFALCGDVVFYGSIGRTDLPGGNYETLMTSIEHVILGLPDDTVLLSGHGPATTVGREREHNPFVADWLARGSS